MRQHASNLDPKGSVLERHLKFYVGRLCRWKCLEQPACLEFAEWTVTARTVEDLDASDFRQKCVLTARFL